MIANEQNILSLKDYAKSFGILVSDDQALRMLRHLDLLVEANQSVNLTRITEPQDAIIRHVVDSLLIIPSLHAEFLGQKRFVDIGTGGGFPGIPLGVMTELEGTLIDSVAKKTRIVSEFLTELNLDTRLSAEPIRAEDLARRSPQSYDYVVARAVAQLGALVEYASPLLKPHGQLVVSKANITDEEVRVGIQTAKIVGLKDVSRETYELPQNNGHREILVFEKLGKSRVKLPRTNGAAVHKPLVS